MSIARQLYQLQEVDLEIESDERTLKEMVSQLGENQAVIKAQAKLDLEQQQMGELKRQQHSAEGDIDGLVSKITKVEEELYSGRVKNPK